jgi:hypothetical protein
MFGTLQIVPDKAYASTNKMKGHTIMRKLLKYMPLLVAIVLMVLAVLPTMAQEATETPTIPVPDPYWRGAGSGPGCPNDESMTTEKAKAILSEDVVRDSDHQCAFSSNGDPMTVTPLTTDWWVINYDVTPPQLVQGGPTVVINTSDFEAFYIPGGNLPVDQLQLLAAEPTQASCKYAAGITTPWVNEQVSVPDSQLGATRVQKKDEDCTFGWRNTHKEAVFPIGSVSTIHPFGDDEIHHDGKDDRVFMWLGDGETKKDVWAVTIRFPLGFSPRDVVNIDFCALWAKEQVNGLNEVPQFFVDAGNLPCEFDAVHTNLVRYYLEQSGSDPDLVYLYPEAAQFKNAA